MNGINGSPLYFILACLAFLFSLFSLKTTLPSILNKKPALILNRDGITDNISSGLFGLIPWNEITHVEQSTYMRSSVLLIFIKSPDQYIQSITGLSKNICERLYQDTGTPFAITKKTIEMSFEKLELLIQQHIKS